MFERLLVCLKSLKSDRSGNVAIIFGLTLIPIVGLVGASLDYNRGLGARTHLQSAVDAAALTSLTPGLKTESEQIDAANKAFAANFDSNAFGISATPTVSINDDTATVSASATMATKVLGVLKIQEMDIGATATAIREEGGPVCMLALNPTMEKAIDITGNATISSIGCAVHANSSHPNAIHSSGGGTLTADSICAVGGVVGGGYSPQPEQNCYKVKDPYANLTPPPTGGCDEVGMSLKKGSFTLSPGVYCDGLEIANEAIVTLLPGIYVIKDGGLEFGTKSNTTGQGVMFYFTGDDTYLDISASAVVDLSAPTSGPYDGLVFFQDPTSNPGQPSGKTNLINGSGSITIVGSIYFPTQPLEITGSGHFGAGSPLLSIVVDHLIISSTMSLKSDLSGAGMSGDLPQKYDGVRLLN